jgi:transcriptional regulator GlxA family with amidase domain
VVFPQAEALDLVGPQEVFSVATHLGRELPSAVGSSSGPRYSTELVAPAAGRLEMSSGLEIFVRQGLSDLRGQIDTLVVVGGLGAREAAQDAALIGWLMDAAPRVRRVASICTGAFLLAKAGLLDGRRATTHWFSCAKLKERYPSVSVDADRVYVRDGHVWTSAGVTAGIDMSLALVADDFGRGVASDVARWLVVFLERSPGQAQLSSQLAAQRAASREPLRELVAWIDEHLDADLSLDALAKRAKMSSRNFSRVFSREVGLTPKAYVDLARIELAKRALEGRQPIAEVARVAGFGTVESLERALRRALGVSPRAYRERLRGSERTAR